MKMVNMRTPTKGEDVCARAEPRRDAEGDRYIHDDRYTEGNTAYHSGVCALGSVTKTRDR